MKRRSSLLFVGLLLLTHAVSCKKDTTGPDPVDPVVETKPAVLTPVTVNVGTNSGGYYEALPAMYRQTQKDYPLLIFFHGSGQVGNGSSDLVKVLEAGTPLLLKNEQFPPDFLVNGQHFSFIILMPQFKSEPSAIDAKAFIDYALGHYRVDDQRVYVAGLSMGGRLTASFGALYAEQVTAIVPMAGALFYDLDNQAKKIADNKVAVWDFHNEQDQVVSAEESKDFVAAINSYNPAIPARLTIFPTSDAYLQHDAWTKATDPAYKENGMNIYEWMLRYVK